jgi:hypothetical protein
MITTYIQDDHLFISPGKQFKASLSLSRSLSLSLSNAFQIQLKISIWAQYGLDFRILD